jgi:enamidase
MRTLLIKNIAQIVTGDLDEPISKGDSVLIEGGKIKAVGLGLSEADRVIDANGMTVIPGLIDCHCHPVLGDWTPRQRALDWISSYLRSGVTGLVSAGEVHLQGRPREAQGCKALAILAHKTCQNYRPAGMKVYGGALILEPDATEEDIAECADAGVTRIGEIGIGKANSPETAGPMVRWARKYGLKTMIHTGGTSLPGSALMGADTLIGIGADVLCHLNGGCIPVPLDDMQRLVNETTAQLEIARIGNPKSAVALLKMALERNELHRIMIGNDAPSGMGVYPQGIWWVICLLTGLTGIAPATTIALATGNTSKFYGWTVGLIKEGYSADLVLIDSPQGGEADSALETLKLGSIPGIDTVIVDGEILVSDNPNSPPPKRHSKFI